MWRESATETTNNDDRATRKRSWQSTFQQTQINYGLREPTVQKEQKTNQNRWEEGATTSLSTLQYVAEHEQGRQVKAPNTCRRPEGPDGSVTRILDTLTEYLYQQRKGRAYKIAKDYHVESNTLLATLRGTM